MKIGTVSSFRRVLTPTIIEAALDRWLVTVESSTRRLEETTTDIPTEYSARWTLKGVGEMWWYQEHSTQLEYWPAGELETIWIDSGRLDYLCAALVLQQARVDP